MKTKILLFFMVLSCSFMFGQRDSLYMSKLRTYQPIDTTEIDRDVEYEVVLKHYSVDEGSVIRRDTVAGYAADYLRQLILDAERDSVNLKSFLEVHFGNFKNVNTEYFNIKNYLTALRNAATGRPMDRQVPEEPAVEKQYICRILDDNNISYVNTSDSLIIGATYVTNGYTSGDDFSNVGGSNYDNNIFQATGEHPAVWANGTNLYLQSSLDTIITSGTLEVGKIYYLNALYGSDDFSNLNFVNDSTIYRNPYIDYSGTLVNYFIATDQPTDWTSASEVKDNRLTPNVFKNDLGATVSFYENSPTLFFVYCDQPIFNNKEYLVDLNYFTSKGYYNIYRPITKNFAVIEDMGGGTIYDLTLKITKFIQP